MSDNRDAKGMVDLGGKPGDVPRMIRDDVSARDLLMLLATEPWWPAARIDPAALAELRHLGFVEDGPDSAPKSKQPIRLSDKGWAEMRVVRERLLDAGLEQRT